MFKTILAVWLAALILAFSVIYRWSFRAGEVGEVPLSLGAAYGSVKVATDKPNLFLFMHPRCSCTRATLTELENLLEQIGDQVHVHLIFFKPKGESDRWAEGEHWRRALKLPNIDLQTDEDGQMAKTFGAKTSGFATLFDRNNHLVFAGGITAARDHVGANWGENKILAFFKEKQPPATPLFGPVFGCSLHSVTRPLREAL